MIHRILSDHEDPGVNDSFVGRMSPVPWFFSFFIATYHYCNVTGTIYGGINNAKIDCFGTVAETSSAVLETCSEVTGAHRSVRRCEVQYSRARERNLRGALLKFLECSRQQRLPSATALLPYKIKLVKYPSNECQRLMALLSCSHWRCWQLLVMLAAKGPRK